MKPLKINKKSLIKFLVGFQTCLTMQLNTAEKAYIFGKENDGKPVEVTLMGTGDIGILETDVMVRVETWYNRYKMILVSVKEIRYGSKGELEKITTKTLLDINFDYVSDRTTR